MAIPPEGADDPSREITASRGIEVRGVVAPERVLVADDRVLPAGDAQGVQVGLALAKASCHVVGRGGRRQVTHQIDRTLVQCPRRIAGRRPARSVHPTGSGVSLRDVRGLEGTRVDPRAVTVAIGQERGRSGTIASSRSFEGVPPGKTSMAQPPPRIHRRSGCVGRVGLDREEVVLLGRQFMQVALEHVEPASDRMHVGILEPRHEHAPREVDDLAPWSRSAPGRRRRCRP